MAGLAPQGIVDAAVLFELGGLIQHLAERPSGPVWPSMAQWPSEFHPGFRCHWEKHKKSQKDDVFTKWLMECWAVTRFTHGLLMVYSWFLMVIRDLRVGSSHGRNECRTMPNLINLVIQ